MFDITKYVIQDKRIAKNIVLILFLIAVIIVCKNKSQKIDNTIDIIPIEAVSVKQSDFSLYISALGTVTPNQSVAIKTQINGQVAKIGFDDGQFVKENDLLFLIDPSAYEAQLEQYTGQIKRDEAILENSLIDLKRYEELWKQNAISRQTLDTQIATVKQNEGIVLLDQGLLDAAQVNLFYCEIRAPFSGKIGISSVSEGALVQSSDQNPIVVLNSLDPILVLFSVPEIELVKIEQEFHKKKLLVEIYDQSFKNLLEIGELVAIDNQIDTSTGMIKLKASFNNQDHKLFPNQFVNVKLMVRKLDKVILIPSPSIQYGPEGSFVYLVDRDKTNVKIKKVILGYSNGDYTVVEQGLEEGDIIATTGVDKLRDGANIIINNNVF